MRSRTGTRLRRLVPAMILAGSIATPVAKADVEPPGGCPSELTYSVKHRMETYWTVHGDPGPEDDVQLAVSVLRPSLDGENPIPGKLPVILQPTPYGKDLIPPRAPDNPFAWWRYGYAHVAVDLRGTGSSFGQADRSIFSDREVRDVIEIINRIADQEWSNGRVGISMQSYTATLGLLVAGHEDAPDALRAVSSSKPVFDLYRDAAYHGGILPMSMVAAWVAWQATTHNSSGLADEAHLPEALAAKADHGMRPPVAFDVIQRPIDGPFYWERSPATNAKRIKVPVFYTEGWLDGFSSGIGRRFDTVFNDWPEGSRLWVEPATHANPAGSSAAPQASDEYYLAENDFMDQFLKGCPPAPYSRVRLSLLSGGVRTGESWPLAGIEYQRLYADASGTLSSVATHGEASYVTKPVDGWTSTLGRYPNIAGVPYRPLDQRLEHGAGLVWETPAAASTYTVAGPARMRVRAASTAPDVDWIVKISELAPSGEARLISEGQLRASHRELDQLSRPHAPYHTHTTPTPIARGTFYDYDIAVASVGIEVKPGYRLRVQLTSNDSPSHLHGNLKLDRNSGDLNFVPHEPATNTVRFGRDGTWIDIPILPSPAT